MQSKTAVITGATSGIGAAFAKQLATQGYNLLLTGRRAEKLNAFAKELSVKHKIKTKVLLAELADEKDLDAVVRAMKKIKNLSVLINNAGFAKRCKYHEEDFATHEKMLRVHVLATMKLTHAVLPIMLKNKIGSIINVSSIAGYCPFPRHSMYTATKAFISIFTESLHYELKKTGVRVQALCPGLTVTDFHERMGHDPKDTYKRRALIWKPMSAAKVVAKSLRALKRNKVICTPGITNKLIIALGTLYRFI